MYLVFRCNCGRAGYAKEGVIRKKCVCGEILKIKDRKILHRTENFQSASDIVRKLQEEKYGPGYLITADKIH